MPDSQRATRGHYDVCVGGVGRQHERHGHAAPGSVENGTPKRRAEQRVRDVVQRLNITIWCD